MHELSIANSLIELASEHLAPEDAGRVAEVHLAIGALSCVHEESLRFGFDLVAQDSALAGAKLIIRHVPVAIYCGPCSRTIELDGIQRFRCPVCDTPSADIRQGLELDLEYLELRDDALEDARNDTSCFCP
jgi:hydrogenase nickel incorporation protein HypA/HybF